MINPTPFMSELLILAQAAGAEIMRIYAQDPEGRLKDDKSPVTDADIAAEKIILDGLSRLAPEIPVVAEEAVAGGAIPVAAEKFFLVDPLDGTREFLSRNGEFTVNIALIEDGKPVAGVVYAPAVERIFFGEHGTGAAEASLAENENLADVHWREAKANPVPATGLRVVASRSHRDNRTEDWLNQHDVAETVAAGSSLKFCLVATGEADIYPRFGRTMEWDTAAGHAVLAAAGGRVETEDGAPLLYGKTERGFDNPGFIASGRRSD